MKKKIDVYEHMGEILKGVKSGALVTGKADDRVNSMTISWGMVGIEWAKPVFVTFIRESRFTRSLIEKNGEFTVNIPVDDSAKKILTFCGSKSGRDVDKWSEMHLTRGNAQTLIYAPIIEESPVNIECQVVKVEELGSHHMFLAKVTGVQVDDRFMQDNGKFALNKTGLLAYSHGEYFDLGKSLGTFGYSVKKKKKVKKKK